MLRKLPNDFRFPQISSDPSLPPKKKILSTLAKESLKIEIELFPLFHMKTKVFLKYFVRGLVWFTKRQLLWPHNFFDANSYCYQKTSSNARKKSNFSKAPNRIFTLDASVFRNSCSQMFYKIGVLKILQIFTEKHLCRNIIFDKVAVFHAGNLLKKSLYRCFSVNFAKMLRTFILQNTAVWLFLPFE